MVVKLIRDGSNFNVNMDGSIIMILFIFSGFLLLCLIFRCCCGYNIFTCNTAVRKQPGPGEVLSQSPQTTLQNGASSLPLPANLYSRQDYRSSVWTVQNSNLFLNDEENGATRQPPIGCLHSPNLGLRFGAKNQNVSQISIVPLVLSCYEVKNRAKCL